MIKRDSYAGNYNKIGFSVRVLCLLTDGFGGHGGIAKFNRDLLTALCDHSIINEVVAIPRLMPSEAEYIPQKLKYVVSGINSKFAFVRTVLAELVSNRSFNLIICGHINLLPVAYLCSLFTRAKIVLIIHGIDAWLPTNSFFCNSLIDRINYLISVSELTMHRFAEWSRIDSVRCFVLPNSIDLKRFTPGTKNLILLDRYNFHGKLVLMTLGRLVSKERSKGFDEVLEILPELANELPNIAYLIVGEGIDKKRLKIKAKKLGVEEHVVFAGKIHENEKVDHYRLSDVFVMPSRGEGFGIVFLEAMACGVPVIGSIADGSREALRNGELGVLIDPTQPEEIKAAILEALKRHKTVPDGLKYFSFPEFSRRLHEIVSQILPSQLPGK